MVVIQFLLYEYFTTGKVLLLRNQNTLSQGKIRKGDDVADDDDHNAVGTSVPPEQVTETLCT